MFACVALASCLQAPISCSEECYNNCMVPDVNQGAQMRLRILRGDAEEKILGPLRLHQWVASITREVEADSGYVVIEAVRASVKHKVALLYTSAVANTTYKQLSTEVEHIFIKGELYKLESYAYGISTPISVADDFFDVLLQWNVATQETAGEAPGVEVKEPTAEVNRIIQSDNPIQGIWIRLRQLHSVALAHKTVARRVDAVKATVHSDSLRTKAEGVSFAVRNATDYFRMREEQGVSQRVLNLYYGTLSFAFAEMLAHPDGPATLAEIEEVTKQGHGLYTVDAPGGGFEGLIIGGIASGFFPRWMTFHGHSTAALPTKKPRLHTDLVKVPVQTFASMEQLFGRVPDIGDLFLEIFQGRPEWLQPVYSFDANKGPTLFGSRGPSSPSTYLTMIDRSGRITRDDVLTFPGGLREVTELSSKEPGRHFRVRVDHEGHEYWHGALALHDSPFVRNTAGTLIRPLFGSVAEFRSIALALLYGLSIVVRYRPSIWRRIQDGDLDQYRALIESFLSVVERVLPEQFLAGILGMPVYVRQPGAL